MKVLHVIPSMATNYGGPSCALAAMLPAFKALGIQVNIATTHAASDAPLTLEPCQELMLFSRGFPELYFYSKDLSRWLDQHTGDYDLVHIHSLFSCPSAIAAYWARRHHKPYVIRPFGTLDKYCMRRHAFRKQMYFELLERNNLNRARFIHCTSSSEKQEIGRLRLKTECVVIPLGLMNKDSIPVRPERSAQHRGIKNILFLSRIDPKKGLELLLRAVKTLKNKRNDFRIFIAGSGVEAYVKRVESMAAQEGIESVISFVGEVRGEQKMDMLQTADVFVLPSYRENFGLAAAEAMQAGCPVVVSNTVAISKEIEEYEAGEIVELNPESIFRALDKLLDNTAARIRMGENGQRLVREQFDLTTNVGKIVSLYKKILSEGKVGP